jgi:hypothetical protein
MNYTIIIAKVQKNIKINNNMKKNKNKKYNIQILEWKFL